MKHYDTPDHEEISLKDERNDERLKNWWPLQEQQQTEVRAHFRWLFVLAGALASFSVPLLAAQTLPFAQRFLIALAIISFLTLITTGVCRMNWILRDWGKALTDLRKGLESNDQKAISSYREREQKLTHEKEHEDIYGNVVHVLFASGAILLILSILVMLMSPKY